MPSSSNIISSFGVIIAFLLCGVLRIAADAQPVDHSEKDHLTRLAIFQLASGLEDDERLGAVFDLLTLELLHKPGIELVERAMVDKIMNEYSLTAGQLVAPQKSIQIGKMAGADVTIMGRLVKLSKTKALWVKVIDNATGIIKGVDYFVFEDQSAKTLKTLAEFAWTASIADIPQAPGKIIAIGSFEDQSINDMQIDRGDAIRRFLEQKYVAASGILVAERSQIRPLLLETGLNRMGFTAAADNSNSARTAYTIVSGDYHVIRKSETIYIVNLRIDLLAKGIKQIQVQNSSWNNVLETIGKEIDGVITSMDGPQNIH